MPNGKPNILVIWGDDIGITNLSCYSDGLMGYRTPNIDRIANEGMRFTDAYGEQSCTAASWVILRGAALASRRIRLATRAPLQTLWNTIGWCGDPPKDSTRTFVIVSVSLTLGCWIVVPILVAIAIAT